mmetsp:Transcript_45353/g.142214  ORF Transcript_45353/g.142214 Transcript_45353/m.142214 type:complete len:262 (+) Transcript_45353:136-921(+)
MLLPRLPKARKSATTPALLIWFFCRKSFRSSGMRFWNTARVSVMAPRSPSALPLRLSTSSSGRPPASSVATSASAVCGGRLLKLRSRNRSRVAQPRVKQLSSVSPPRRLMSFQVRFRLVSRGQAPLMRSLARWIAPRSPIFSPFISSTLRKRRRSTVKYVSSFFFFCFLPPRPTRRRRPLLPPVAALAPDSARSRFPFTPPPSVAWGSAAAIAAAASSACFFCSSSGFAPWLGVSSGFGDFVCIRAVPSVRRPLAAVAACR